MDVKEVKKLTHFKNFLGTNQLSNISAKNTFYWRGVYKYFGFPNQFTKPPIDFWYDDLYYGRRDKNNYPIYLKESALKQLPTTNTTVLSLNFVSDAYYDFLKYMVESKQKGIIRQSAAYSNLEPVRSFVPVHSQYHYWMSEIYFGFSESFLLQTGRSSRMRDFKSYIELFLEFVSSPFGAPNIPITKEKWISSNLCSPLASGMIYEIRQENHGDDTAKQEYLFDSLFPYVSQAAGLFGFKIDKNAPWRFVADLSSEKMVKYMRAYNYNTNNLYDKAFYRTYEFDLDSFKHYIWSWYNEFILYNPIGDMIVDNPCQPGVLRKTFERRAIPEQEFFSYLKEEQWLRMYFYVRALEERVTWTQSEFDSHVKKAVEYMRYKGKEYALMYVYNSVIEDKGIEKLYLKKELTEAENSAIMAKQRRQRNITSGFSF